MRLNADWTIGAGAKAKNYSEHAILGYINGKIRFWSFTSDGKRSEGESSAAPDIHKDAIAFEANMPAGRARMAYWPAEDGGMMFAVEAQTKKGWSRMVEHHYLHSTTS